MLQVQHFNGEKYTLHIYSYNGKHKIRWSDNQINAAIGTVCLQADILSVDELVKLIKDKNP